MTNLLQGHNGPLSAEALIENINQAARALRVGTSIVERGGTNPHVTQPDYFHNHGTTLNVLVAEGRQRSTESEILSGFFAKVDEYKGQTGHDDHDTFICFAGEIEKHSRSLMSANEGATRPNVVRATGVSVGIQANND